jgi:AcrR family transcriptional regulator
MSSKQRVRRAESQKDMGTRDKLIAAAAAILTEEGSGAISTRHVADRAGVNQALVHYHFTSIENLMLEVLRGTAAQAMAAVQARYAGPRDFVDKWLADLNPEYGETGLFEPKAWLEIMGIVVNDDSLMEVYRKDFVDPNYAIMRNAAAESLSRSGKADDATIEVITSFALMIRAGVFITYLLGRNPAQDRAVELAAKFLREYIQSLSEEADAPAPST